MDAARPANFPIVFFLAASSLAIHLSVLAILLFHGLFRYVPLAMLEKRAALKPQPEEDGPNHYRGGESREYLYGRESVDAHPRPHRSLAR